MTVAKVPSGGQRVQSNAFYRIAGCCVVQGIVKV